MHAIRRRLEVTRCTLYGGPPMPYVLEWVTRGSILIHLLAAEPPSKKKVKFSMARSLPVENLLPQNVESIINYLQQCYWNSPMGSSQLQSTTARYGQLRQRRWIKFTCLYHPLCTGQYSLRTYWMVQMQATNHKTCCSRWGANTLPPECQANALAACSVTAVAQDFNSSLKLGDLVFYEELLAGFKGTANALLHA